MSEPERPTQRERLPLSTRCELAAKKINELVRSARRTEIADLRRLGRPGHPIPGRVGWEFIDRYAEEEEEIWPVVLPLMTRVSHVPGSLGRALHNAGISPPRLERWLRRDRQSALSEARLLLLRVHEGLPWGTLGELLHEWSPELRGKVARDFYRAQRRSGAESASTSSTATP